MIQQLLFLLFITTSFGFVRIQHQEYEHVAGEYVVTYHQNTTTEEAIAHFRSLEDLGVVFIGKYNQVKHKGFAAKIPEDLLLPLQHNSIIKSIEVNRIFHLDYAQQSCDGITDRALSWGLSRVSYSGKISEAPLPDRFIYPSNGGAGTTVYVLDTGIYTSHTDFGGRATVGINLTDDVSTDDLNGHGTHCAGTIGGTNYGVAKSVSLVAVKVLNQSGTGTLAGIVSGVNWVVTNGKPFKSILSLSLGASGIHEALRTAIDSAVSANYAVVVAAGNANQDACNFSPAGFASAITVGATEINGARTLDTRASYSNWGNCVDVFGPGSLITSTWIGSNTATNTISGTSMACPHVAGISAIELGLQDALAPKDLEALLISKSQKDIIASIGSGSPNRLAFTGCSS